MFDPLILGFAQSEGNEPGNVTLWLPAALIDRYPAQHATLLEGIRVLPGVRTFNLRVHDNNFNLLECRVAFESKLSAATAPKKIADMIGTLYATSVEFVEATALDRVLWPEPAIQITPIPQPVPPIAASKGWFGRLVQDFTLKWVA